MKQSIYTIVESMGQVRILFLFLEMVNIEITTLLSNYNEKHRLVLRYNENHKVMIVL